MYIRRFHQSLRLEMGDRILDHFGGPKGSDLWAGYIVQAGYVTEKARHLIQSDLSIFPELFRLTIEMFPDFQKEPGLLERQGIIRYRRFRPPLGVSILPRPYLPPKPGNNFLKFLPSDPEYNQLNSWWHAVVRRGQYGRK
jgi:hypothetical protein